MFREPDPHLHRIGIDAKPLHIPDITGDIWRFPVPIEMTIDTHPRFVHQESRMTEKIGLSVECDMVDVFPLI